MNDVTVKKTEKKVSKSTLGGVSIAAAWRSTSASATRLSAQDGGFAAAGATTARLRLEHRRVLQHIRQDQESDFGAAYVDILQLRNPSITVSDCIVFHLEIHVVFGFDEFTAVDFARG